MLQRLELVLFSHFDLQTMCMRSRVRVGRGGGLQSDTIRVLVVAFNAAHVLNTKLSIELFPEMNGTRSPTRHQEQDSNQ